MTSLFQTDRQTGGTRARNSGKEFEQLILASQNDRDGAVCVLERIKSYAKWIPEKRPDFQRLGQRLQLMQEPSPFDFAGSVWGKGTAIFFDAKSCNEDMASLRTNDPKIVKLHQIAALQRLEAAGAFSGFLVRCERIGDYRFLWASQINMRDPVRWNDPAWEVLGPIEAGRGVPLRRLFERYT